MQIKQLELTEKDSLLSFLRAVYPNNPRLSESRFWNWHYPQNPYVETNNLSAWIAKDDGKIVGHLGAIPVRLKIGDEQKSAIWAVDLVVHPDYRRKGLARNLVIAAEDFCPRLMAINTVRQHSTALFEGLGWRMIGKIPRYNKLLFPGEAVREISRIKSLRRFANFSFAPLRPRSIKDFFNKNNRLRFIEKIDADFDDLWRQASAHWSCAVSREAAFLRWQYAEQPDKKFDVLGFYASEKLLGYVVLYFRKAESNGALPKAAITDFCYHPAQPTETIDALLQGALQLALERRAGALVIDVSDSLIEERLRFFGFGRVKNPLQLIVKSAEQQQLFYDAGKWLITRGDSDVSIFEEPNL
ncbi:MAG: GNAT family N-acetyltransferase [Pyrinomonadaceae bacterium]